MRGVAPGRDTARWNAREPAPADRVPPCRVTVEPSTQDRVRVVVRGEVDLAAEAALRAAFASALELDKSLVDVDLGDVTFLDAAGVGMLMTAVRVAASRGRVLRVSRVASWPRRILEITGTADVLGVTGPADRSDRPVLGIHDHVDAHYAGTVCHCVGTFGRGGRRGRAGWSGGWSWTA